MDVALVSTAPGAGRLEIAPDERTSLSAIPTWARLPLQVVERVSPEAVVLGMLLDSIWFCGRLGPTHAPVEVDVLIPRSAEVRATHAALQAMLPRQRWRVFGADSIGGSAGLDPIAGALQYGPLTISLAGVQARGAECIHRFGHPLTARHLAAGELVPHGPDAVGSRAEAIHLLARFPGLRAEFMNYPGKTLEDSYSEIERMVLAGERGGRRTVFAFSPAEGVWVDRIREWHARTTPAIEPLPIPPRASLPDADPWWAPDEEFREWIVDQALLRVARTVPDQALQAMIVPQRGEQKPTHQGWETAHHAVMAALALDTADLDPRDRRALRVATLLHDIGKIHNVWTPGSHPLIGAKVWRNYAPDWLTEPESQLITFLIANHDALGLMDRGIMNPDFRGAVTPAELRNTVRSCGRSFHEALRLNSALYQADIGSVAALRWLLPLTPLLEGIVLAGLARADAV